MSREGDESSAEIRKGRLSRLEGLPIAVPEVSIRLGYTLSDPEERCLTFTEGEGL